MNRVVLISVITLLGLSACGGAVSEVGVDFTGKDTVYLIPSDAQSCYSQAVQAASGQPVPNDVTQRYFQIRNFKMTWSALDATFEVASILVRVQAKDLTGKIENLVISGNELHSLDASAGGWSGTLAKAPSVVGTDGKLQPVMVAGAQQLTTFTASCSPIFGGVNVPDDLDKGTKYIAAEMTIVGTKRFDDGREEPASVKSTFTLVNYGLH